MTQINPTPVPPPQTQPPYPPTGYPAQPNSLGLESLVPYKNGAALAAYYLGIFAFIPVLGILLGVPAFILGIVGVKRANQYPQIKGKVHAWVGIICGGLFGFGQLSLIPFLLFA